MKKLPREVTLPLCGELDCAFAKLPPGANTLLASCPFLLEGSATIHTYQTKGGKGCITCHTSYLEGRRKSLCVPFFSPSELEATWHACNTHAHPGGGGGATHTHCYLPTSVITTLPVFGECPFSILFNERFPSPYHACLGVTVQTPTLLPPAHTHTQAENAEMPAGEVTN